MKRLLSTILSLAILLMPSIASADLSTGLVMYFPMDKRDFTSSTVFLDRSSGGRTASLVGTAALGGGKMQQGLTFTGVDGNGVSISSGISTGITFTISIWLYTGATSIDYSALLVQSNLAGIWYRPGTRLVTYYYGADHQNNTAMSLNTWHNVVITNSLGNLTFYIDGVADGTALAAPAFTANSFGCDNGTGGECMNGKLDDLRLYDRVLDVTEIKQLYRQGLGRLR